MKWVTAAAMGLVLVGCSKDAEQTEPQGKIVAVEPAEAAKVITPVKPVKKVVTLAAGTAIKIRTDSAISTKTAETGDAFTGVLAEALRVDGDVVAPKGAAVTGVVAEADEGGRVKGVASLSLRLTRITIAGKAVPVDTGVFVKDAPATKKKDAIKVGIGAGVGAVVGAIAGGGKGAAVGAATGGAAGTGVVLATHGDPAVVDAESLITFKLKGPVDVK